MQKTSPRWTQEELAILAKQYPFGVKRAAMHLPHRTISSISDKAKKIGVVSNYRKTKANSKKPFSQIEIAYLCENYSILGPSLCAVHMERTTNAVKAKAIRLGLTHSVEPDDDPWATAQPVHKVTSKWTPDAPPGPRWVFDLANHLGMQQEELDMA